MMEAAVTSETSINSYQTTQRNILEDSHFQLQKKFDRHGLTESKAYIVTRSLIDLLVYK
jgi:hypothetical protein